MRGRVDRLDVDDRPPAREHVGGLVARPQRRAEQELLFSETGVPRSSRALTDRRASAADGAGAHGAPARRRATPAARSLARRAAHVGTVETAAEHDVVDAGEPQSGVVTREIQSIAAPTGSRSSSMPTRRNATRETTIAPNSRACDGSGSKRKRPASSRGRSGLTNCCTCPTTASTPSSSPDTRRARRGVRCPEVVGVEERQDREGRSGDAVVHSAGEALWSLPDHRDVLRVGVEQLGRAVARSVVDDDDLTRRGLLLQDAVEGFAQIALAVADRHHDADLGSAETSRRAPEHAAHRVDDTVEILDRARRKHGTLRATSPRIPSELRATPPPSRSVVGTRCASRRPRRSSPSASHSSPSRWGAR